MKNLKLLITVLLLTGFVCAAKAQSKKTIIYPGVKWEKTVDSIHWDNKHMAALLKYVTDSTHITGMTVIDGGKQIFEYGDLKELSYIASCRKSVCAMLYGPFIESGKIDLKTTIGQLGIDDIGGLLPIEKTATIDDILTARSGIFHPASNGGDALYLAPKRGSKKPGTFWLYSNWDFNLAGYILEQAAGKEIHLLVDSMLAKPLQMQDWDLNAQEKPRGDTTQSRYLPYHMWFSAEDMARLGYLMLRNGKWKDKQVIPADWVQKITTEVTSNKQARENKDEYYSFGYAYLWWTLGAPYNTGPFEGAYTAQGSYGNFITVLPKLDLVIAIKTKAVYERNTTIPEYFRILTLLSKAYQD
ncbi:hypothetical protein BEL04_03545 [Mucilaginibacter sp. PPCGB 2223]|uniref:serine hydrolase domain-containing protein n=1 Tax=Mucilaginibacter sp. PPCGB 2223 TaxID=1886027 RepID=UPI0008258405|nr:serine hydrolase [Mucilaginibacter sp. PPCGB 2223]OCX53387.1 hypothetical protein BEL04_03545 [Mucilaginibacter sp. PPCGB 2223]